MENTTVKLKFDANQDFQKEAIDSIVNIFDGQALRKSKFTAHTQNDTLFGKMTELGIGNKLDLDHEDLLKNVIAVQDENKLKRSKGVIDTEYGVPNFTIEMETGTGKTYVYTRTILELHQKYGFTKFIVVVPSVAIREGVKTSFKATAEHFDELYPGQAFHSFVYNSTKLNDVQSFATSDSIEVMIINIDAFRKSFTDTDDDSKANVIHKESDALSGRRPIEFIQQTNPVVIIDEPQSVDNTEKSQEAIKSLNPMAILRYSATHRKEYNLMYRLGPIEAYERRLVKQIEVMSVSGGEEHGAYIKLKSVSNRNGTYSAKVHMKQKNTRGEVGLKEVLVNVNRKNDLFVLSNEIDEYTGKVVTNISVDPGAEYIELQDGTIIRIATERDDMEIKRAQIRYTIERHLDKEMSLLDKGIKVISLFFIDKVANYRESEIIDGQLIKKEGPYFEIFEKEYLEFIKNPKYQTLFQSNMYKEYALNKNVDVVHDGYFAQDKKGVLKESREGRSTAADESAYKLIMEDKERLLSLDTPLRFIFSHSALKEGWDNPNVFQICTLVDQQDTLTKRQKIGRGLRLPVDQKGNRIKDDQINILTVSANESYEDFAEGLQKEIEDDTNTHFGVIDARLFEDILVKVKDGDKLKELGYDNADKLVEYLQQENLINAKGKASPELKESVVKGELNLPEEYKKIEGEIIEEIKNSQKRLPILDASKKVKLELNKEIYLSSDFEALWDKIKYKSVYRLNFDNDKLINNCTEKVRLTMLKVEPSPIVAKFVNVTIKDKGIEVSDPNRIRTMMREDSKDISLPNILLHIEKYTRLKRDTIAKILIDSGRLEEFYLNPQEFMERVVSIINQEKRLLIVDGISYEKIGGDSVFAQELFRDDELIGYLNSTAIKTDKSVYDHIVHDPSNVERDFAQRLNSDIDVKVFVKLPAWFKIDTPLGTYNPDWAVLLDKNGEEKLYFVLETKGSIKKEDLRLLEESKIRCGKKHFEAMDENVKFEVASEYDKWRSSLL